MIQRRPGGVAIDVRVIPRGRKSGVVGRRGDALLVRLQAPPVEGAANAELVGIIAAVFGVSKRAVSIVSGDRSRQKRVYVTGIDEVTAASRLAAQMSIS